MNANAFTAQNCSLFEIDGELEAAFDQLQEEREITGNISDESRERCAQLFAELGKKIDRIAAYLRTQERKAGVLAHALGLVGLALRSLLLFPSGSEDQWGCRSSTLPSRVSLERRNRLLSKGNELILAGRRDKMEISG
jgi:hypothetical protein